MKANELYVDLIANPFAARTYRALAKYYESIGKQTDADAFWYALSVKFDEPDRTPAEQEQRSDTGLLP